MIPILYDYSETRFITNGIGRLSDCVSCTVTEERNGVYECEFIYPITGERYADIQEGRVILVAHDDTGDTQPFDIYGRSAPINGLVTFYAHHVSYRLNDVIVDPFTADNINDALTGLKTNSINTNQFNFTTDKATAGDFNVLQPDRVRGLLGGQEGSILDVYGSGDYEFDRFDVILHSSRGTDSNVEIRYGKNLIDITHEIDQGEAFNAVVPYWIDPDDGSVMMLPEKMVVHGGIIHVTELTDDQLIIIRTDTNDPIEVAYQVTNAQPLDLTYDFEEKPTEAELRTAATNYLNNSKGWLGSETINVDFVQLWQTEEYKNVAPLQRVRLCDTVSVYYPELGVEAVRIRVIKTVYNVLLDRYDEMELGEPTTTLAEALTPEIKAALDAPTKSSMDAAIQHATDLIRGGLGGYVVIGTNADGKPNEILIMDTPDIDTAVNVWRWNSGGLAHSSNGYNGTYSDIALTMDGQIVADAITSGTMSANRIRGGELWVGGINDLAGKILIFDTNGSVVGGISNTGIYMYLTGSHTAPDETFRHTLVFSTASMQLYRSDQFYGMVGLQEYYQQGAPGWDAWTAITGKDRVVIEDTGSGNGYGYTFRATSVGSQSEHHSFGSKVYVYGAFGCSGTKSRTVDTKNYGNRSLYAYETPTPLFGDIGEAVIDEDGFCYVEIDDIFTETIAERVEYQVFLQKEGAGDCWVDEKQRNYFVIAGTPGLRVAWELKAKQRDYEWLRLETNENLDEYETPTDELLQGGNI